MDILPGFLQVCKIQEADLDCWIAREFVRRGAEKEERWNQIMRALRKLDPGPV